MKRFVKLSEVKKNLRNGCQLAKNNMASVNGGTDDTNFVISQKICPYLNAQGDCPYLYTDYAAPCPYNYQCYNVSLYSSPTCIAATAANDETR
jgi:hypothetical protein